jgi:hypothetical protein
MKYGLLKPVAKHFRTIMGSSNQKRSMVVCLCDCGGYICCRLENLKSGDTKSCGCQRNIKTIQRNKSNTVKIPELVLRHFYIDKNLTRKEIAEIYSCCQGTITKKLRQYGIKKPIGGEYGKSWLGIGDLSKTYWSQIKLNAKNRNIDIDISIEYVWKLFQDQNGQCKLSGMKISLNLKDHTASLDRIYSSKGYIEGNIQWVHRDVNLMKNKFSQDYFLELCDKINNRNK